MIGAYQHNGSVRECSAYLVASNFIVTDNELAILADALIDSAEAAASRDTSTFASMDNNLMNRQAISSGIHDIVKKDHTNLIIQLEANKQFLEDSSLTEIGRQRVLSFNSGIDKAIEILRGTI